MSVGELCPVRFSCRNSCTLYRYFCTQLLFNFFRQTYYISSCARKSKGWKASLFCAINECYAERRWGDKAIEPHHWMCVITLFQWRQWILHINSVNPKARKGTAYKKKHSTGACFTPPSIRLQRDANIAQKFRLFSQRSAQYLEGVLAGRGEGRTPFLATR
jgi:hypothetical protein